MSANLDDFLPSIFRKRKPVIKDEWGGPSDQNILDSSGVVRSDALASVAPVVTDTPVGPTAAMVGQDSGGTGITRARRVETDNKGRPIANTTMKGDAQAIDLNQRIHDYRPQAAQGWWDKWGKQMVTGAVKGLRYGPGGALGGAVAGGISGKLNPEMADEQWKDENIATSDAEVKRIAQARQAKTKMVQEAAATELVKARTDALTHPAAKPGHPILTDQGWSLLDPVSGTIKPVVDPKTGRQAKGKPTNAKEEWVHDEKGVAHKYEDGKDTGQLDPGRDLKVVPGYGLVPPGQAMNADATAANRETERQDRASQDVLTNSQLDENIRTATQSRDAMGAPPPVYIEKTNPLGDKEQVVNPAYNEWQSRRTAYDSQIAGWKAQKKAPPSLKPTSGGRKYTIDPKFLQ